MKQVHSSRQDVEAWHCQEEATIDHLVRLLTGPGSTSGMTHSAFTATGLAIEDQIRKAWRPDSVRTVGLAMF